MKAKEFLEAVYGHPDILQRTGLKFALTTFNRMKQGGGPTHRFDDFDSAVYKADSLRDSNDIYFNLGLHIEDLGTDKRGTGVNIGAHPGFYLDIDIQNPKAHKKVNIPKTREEAMDIFMEASVGRKPTLFVDSGYGLHIYMLLPEPIMLDDQNREDYQKDLVRCHKHFLSVMQKRGYTMDSTFDLPRILRLPGTLNWKDKADPKDCVVVDYNPKARYSRVEWTGLFPEFSGNHRCVDDLGKQRVACKRTGSKRAALKLEFSDGAEITIDPTATINPMCLEALLENYPKFKKYWNLEDRQERLDHKPPKDASASSYEMSLTNIMVAAGLSDQEIANAIIHFRREKFGDPGWLEKLQRSDYIRFTIAAARKGSGEVAPREEVLAGPATEEETPDTYNEIMKAISKLVGSPIERIIKYKGENNSVYDIKTSRGTIRVPSTEYLVSFTKFKTCVADATNYVIQKGYKPDQWARFAQMILNVVIEQEVESSSTQEIVCETVKSLIARSDNDNWRNAIVSRRPFTHKGNCFVFIEGVRQALRAEGHIIGSREIGLALKREGYEPVKKNFTSESGARTSTWVYKIKAEERVPGLEEDSEDGSEI